MKSINNYMLKSTLLKFLCFWVAVIVWNQTPLFAQSPDFFTSNGKEVSVRFFDAEMVEMMKNVGIPGASLAIIENNQIVFYKTYGRKDEPDGKTVNRKTVFEAASLSKSFLVYTAFKLVDEGKLDLDKPLYMYKQPEKGLLNDLRYKLITARMVLSHSSGIENWKKYNNPDALEIVSNPGDKYVYSGTAYNWLAEVIQVIVGKPYEEYTRQMVIKPLHLKRSFVNYERKGIPLFKRIAPVNYASGHTSFNKVLPKWKNSEAVPSSGNNITAEDYAKLLLATFDKTHLSPASVSTLLTPRVKTSENIPSYYGTGFEIFYTNNDTIIGHGGDNDGFKTQAFYSIKNKRGFVVLTNSNRGKSLITQLSKMTAGLPVAEYCQEHFLDQYPSNSNYLLKVYREDGKDYMLSALEKIKSEYPFDEAVFYALGWEIMEVDRKLAKRLFEDNLKLYPNSSTTYGFLGELYMKERNYSAALNAYQKARDLKYKWQNLDGKIAACETLVAEEIRRKSLLAQANQKGELMISADNYNSMKGVDLGALKDNDEMRTVGHMNKGDWMEFRILIPFSGSYQANFRVASRDGDSKLQLNCDTNELLKLDVMSTKSWTNWATLTKGLELLAGEHVFKLYVPEGKSGLLFNWLKVEPANHITTN